MRRAQSNCSFTSKGTFVSPGSLPFGVTATAFTLLPPRSMPRAKFISKSERALSYTPATIDREHLAGDEFRFVAHEEHGGGIEIVWLADAPAVERLLGLDEIQNRI